MVTIRRGLIAATITASLVATAGSPLATGHSGVLAAAPSGPPTWGISDQDPSRLGDQLYMRFANGMGNQGRPIHTARIIVPYNTVSNKDPGSDKRWIPRLDALKGRFGEGGLYVVLDCKAEAGQRAEECPVPPSLDAYRKGFAALRNAYPGVHYWGAWNEPDLLKNGTHGSPTQAAKYWAAAQKICLTPPIPSAKPCEVVAGEFHSALGYYITRYQAAVKKAMKAEGLTSKPTTWSFHPYREIISKGGSKGGHETKIFKARLTGYWGSPKVWFTEVGVCLICGKGSKGTVVGKADQEQTALNLIEIAKSNNVQRVYYYSLVGNAGFDAALQGAHGLRPAYCVLAGDPGPCPDTDPSTVPA